MSEGEIIGAQQFDSREVGASMTALPRPYGPPCPDCGHHRGYHGDDCPGPWMEGERDPGWALAGPCTARRLGRQCRLIWGHEGGHDA